MNTRSKTQPSKRIKKKTPISDDEPQTRIQCYSVDSSLDSEIQQSNSQLSITLSTNFNPKQISCRDYEKEVITKFIKSCLGSDGQQNSRVLYISGVPGVGKTVSTMEIVNKIKKSVGYKKATFKYINAMSLSSPSQVYKKINNQIYNPEKNDLTQNPPLKLMIKMKEDKRIKFLIIDQVDYLYTKNQNILYNLFQWCSIPETRLCIVIIANTMDFPQKLMPKLKSRMGDNRLVFKPYSQNQVQKIIQQRLMKSNRFSKDAVTYACKKMSSFTSDVRKLLDVLKRALQNKHQGIISLDDMFQTWRNFAQQSGQLWQQKLPQFYRNIINIIKDQGGFTTSDKINIRMNIKQQYKQAQTLDILKSMQQMAIIRLKQKNKKGLKFYEVTLLKI